MYKIEYMIKNRRNDREKYKEFSINLEGKNISQEKKIPRKNRIHPRNTATFSASQLLM